MDKIWLTVSEGVAAEDLQDAFQSYFGAEWNNILDAADKSFAYNALNNAYFAVRDLHPLQDLTLERFLELEGIDHPLNIIVS